MAYRIVKRILLALFMAVLFFGCSNSSTDTDLSPSSQERINDLKERLPEETYKEITKDSRTNPACKEVNRAELGLSDKINGDWYYTYDNMIKGMAALREFANEGDDNLKKLEIAAFLANVAQETGSGTGKYGGPGCFIQEGGGSARGSCAYGGCAKPGVGWCGRGPHQLSWGSNYLAFGQARGEGSKYRDDPDLLTTDPEIGIAGSIWFWGHQEDSSEFPPDIPFKPSAHNVVVGKWTPTKFDKACGRTKAGLGIITNIINGGIECGPSASDEGRENAKKRVRYFEAIATEMGVKVPTGWADDCAEQRNFDECHSYMNPATRCGASWADANNKCGTLCVVNSNCPSGETCYSGLDTKPCENVNAN